MPPCLQPSSAGPVDEPVVQGGVQDWGATRDTRRDGNSLETQGDVVARQQRKALPLSSQRRSRLVSPLIDDCALWRLIKSPDA